MFNPEDILNHYQKPVPRYTSYPTAPHFRSSDVGSKGQSENSHFNAAISTFNDGLAALDPEEAISVYIHIPFCDRLCWFCGCHTKHTLKYAPIQRYIQSLIGEIGLVSDRLSFRPRLGQLHLGGGSPSLLIRDDLRQLRHALDTAFIIDDATEISIEIDPSDVDANSIQAMVDFGLTRASVGVQDFHEDVQNAINRPQSFEVTRDVIAQLRAAGVESINIDALYGLPLQSHSRLSRTIEQCITLAPDRMALFGYAHVPWLKKHQNMIRTEDLAGPLERYQHAQSASRQLIGAGYQAIGIDHFALPGDALSRAACAGKLHRNFQGYTTDAHETLIGFGASSIGRFSDAYVQNTVPTLQYQHQIGRSSLPKAKYLHLTEEDKLRGSIIERLMCDFALDFDNLDNHPASMVAECLRLAQKFVVQDAFDLCELDGSNFIIKPQARAFARIVAAQFDAYYTHDQFQYSRAV